MIINYSSTYTLLEGCPKEFALELSNNLGHLISEDYLKLFLKSFNSKCITSSYLFNATKNKKDDSLFDITLLSGLVPDLYKGIQDGISVLDIDDVSFINNTNSNVLQNAAILKNNLYEHQIKIVENCLRYKRGIIKSPTGSGKSYSIAELVRVFNNQNLNILITVPTINLLYQMIDDINNYFDICNINKLDIKKVGDGNYEFGNVVVGIPNSLSNIDKTKDYLNTVDVLLCDEVHLAVNPTYAYIIEYTNKRIISLGFSATPDVVDGTNIMAEGFFGPRICTITEAEMIQKNVILEPKFVFYTAPKGFLPNSLNKDASNITNLTDGHRYKIMPQVYKWLIINNDGRNKLIIKEVKKQVEKNNGPVIIIVAKVKGDDNHADVLSTLLTLEGINFPIISGYISKKKRELIIQDLKDSKIQGVIAGPKVLSAGISIPSLSTIVLAGAGKSDSDFIQRVGRLLRKKEGKENPLVIDFIDQQFWFANQSKSRLKIASEIYGDTNIQIF